MGQDWPSPNEPERSPLPQVDDLPVAERGYQQERVQEAFDAFYRHLAQLDSTLRSLEAVDVFRQQAADLRADLRSIRAAGWSPYPRGYPIAPAPTFGIPNAVPRIALEVAFLIIVAVVVAVGGFGAVAVVAVMALAFAVTALAEYLAARDRAPIARIAPTPAVPAAAVVHKPSVAVADEAEPEGWAAFAEPSGPEALTVMEAISLEPERSAERAADPEPASEAAPVETAESTEEIPPAAPVADAEAAPEPARASAPVPADEDRAEEPRRRWGWRRRQQRDEAEAEAEAGGEEQPKHVRVLPQPEPVLEQGLDPWERGFDFDLDESKAETEADAEEEPAQRPPR